MYDEQSSYFHILALRRRLVFVAFWFETRPVIASLQFVENLRLWIDRGDVWMLVPDSSFSNSRNYSSVAVNIHVW